MCGFAAMLGLQGKAADAAVLEGMMAAISHRGPDDSGIYLSGTVGLGFRRLSILDLTQSGHQPMSSRDGACTIVFNGEIYNYRELRAELEGAGYSFHSTGDTEVLLSSYLHWGVDCVSRLNGMWAFLIHDRRRGLVFGSRDRFGIKPLFMNRNHCSVLFASEIKAIRASRLAQEQTNWSVAADFLLRGRLDQTSETFYTGVAQIPPATAFELTDDGRYREWRYWSLEDAPESDPSRATDEFAELFEDSVRLHMRSDVPVGVHLSGGLDSTSIICAAARLRAEEGSRQSLMAFSFIESEYDETNFINDTLRQTQAQLVRLESDPVRFWNNLKEVLWYQDEPFHSIYLLVAYELMRMTAAHGVKVVLNGQGADETLAGYPSYFRDYWNGLIRAGQPAKAWDEMGRYVAVHGGSRLQLLAAQAKHLAQGALRQSRQYRRAAAWNERKRLANDDWFSPEFCGRLPARDDGGDPRDLNGALAFSIRRQPLPLYLRIEDRISMAHSIESRVPFLDHRLVSYAYGLPSNWKMRGPLNKFILREAMRGRIPESVRNRPEKFGFPVPARRWLADRLFEPAREAILTRQASERGIYQMRNIERDLERYRRGEIDVTYKLFNVVQFETWSAIEPGFAPVRGKLGTAGPDRVFPSDKSIPRKVSM